MTKSNDSAVGGHQLSTEELARVQGGVEILEKGETVRDLIKRLKFTIYDVPQWFREYENRKRTPVIL